ncbi:MAG TPA: NAD(P)-dependent oxidoreductase [Thermoleophilaceae bacterium]|jgi:3-hydroxyisobutyrate dehydrogenase-like beta-hydroxyacid dehydrogenase
MSEIERVAFLGTGIMGSRMAANVVVGEFEVKVWNRTREKAEAVAELSGAGVADTPAEAAEGADAVITMVVDSPQVESVLFGENGAAAVLKEGALVVDMSTIAPTAVQSIAERLGQSGIHFMDAPVSGSSPKAEDATLTIMAGGSDEDFKRALPLLESMGELIVHCGPLGHGQMVKLLNNTLAATNAAVLAEAIAVAEKADLDMNALVKVVAASSGNSTMLGLKAGPMIEHKYEPLFKLDHMLKDVRHCLNAAQELGSKTPVAEAAKSLYEAASALGKGDEDFAAVIEAVEPV